MRNLKFQKSENIRIFLVIFVFFDHGKRDQNVIKIVKIIKDISDLKFISLKFEIQPQDLLNLKCRRRFYRVRDPPQIFEDVTTIFSIRNALSVYVRSCLCLKSSDFVRNRMCVIGLG